jgi:hypothetical protein
MLVVTVGILTLGGSETAAATGPAGEQQSVDRPAVTQAAAAVFGGIVGLVADAGGQPLDGAMISAFGPSGAELALSDEEGRFRFRSLQPGAYLVQAHLSGFVASRRELVEVAQSPPAVHVVTLSRVGQTARPITAGLGLSGRVDTAVQPSGSAPADGVTSEPLGPHDHSEKAWRLRRARRSVLKNAEGLVPGRAASGSTAEGADAGVGPVSLLARTLGSPARFATGLLALPLRGEVNLLTRGTLDSVTDALTAVPGSAGIANLAVGAPVWRGDWLAQGAMTTGDLSSWVVSGAYVADVETAHRLGLAVSYGRQYYEGGNPSALTVASESRYAASFDASDSWTVSPALTLDFGGRYSTYGYIEEDGLMSPRASVTVSPFARTRIRVAAAQETVAPGADEFLPPSDTGLWLPPERTFAAFTAGGGLHPERTRHFDVGLEYDLTEHDVIGVRRFYQDVSDQMATLFGIDELGNAPTGHYYLARAGSVTSRGWVVTLRHQLSDRVSGSVDYAIADAHWNQAGADSGLADVVQGFRRLDIERFHDVSGTVETEIPETATRVFVRARFNTAFVRTDSEHPTGLDTRFDVRVNQALPFSPFDGSQWEVLVSVRSLFFEPHIAASTFDELLVARPPKQYVGGLVVHF